MVFKMYISIIYGLFTLTDPDSDPIPVVDRDWNLNLTPCGVKSYNLPFGLQYESVSESGNVYKYIFVPTEQNLCDSLPSNLLP